MKKREKKLTLAKETLINLDEGKDMKAILGGGNIASCTVFTTSTAGGSGEVCC
ncbi:MAG TPA: hypothetical protein VLB76_28325 [Thermoanaerobaculia bacterium]|jgi:hypothetical protein|nr:hypothetical protein [Thermoanaerobaculia bacterium]